MNKTPRLSLNFLSTGQAQKETTVNEAFQTLDALVAGAVEGLPRSDPPASAPIGAAYIVGSSPTGVWGGKSKCIASYTVGGWRFVDPVDGMTVYVKAEGTMACFRLGAWEIGSVRGSQLIVNGQQVVGPRGSEIAPATGGTTVDAEARAAVNSILAALREHGLIHA